jgi:rod shape-determining protein MreB and related proteins
MIVTLKQVSLFQSIICKQEIAIHLGPTNTLIIHNDKVVLNEPSIVAIEHNTQKIVAVGKKALMMHEKTHDNLKTIRPLADGVIANFDVAEAMIRELTRLIPMPDLSFKPSWTVLLAILSDITEVERLAVRDSAEQAGGKEAYMIYEPMAAALGIGIDVCEPFGSMIVDIGGGTTGITVIALGGIVCDQSIRIAGEEFTQDIMVLCRESYGLLIGERSAEQIKIMAGSAIKELEFPIEEVIVYGRDMVSGIPRQISVSYTEVDKAPDKSIQKIEEAIDFETATVIRIRELSLMNKVKIHEAEWENLIKYKVYQIQEEDIRTYFERLK